MAAFCIFEPLAVPERDGFKEYGLKDVDLLVGHYHTDEEEIGAQLRSEWNNMKYHLKDILKPKVLKLSKKGEAKQQVNICCQCLCISSFFQGSHSLPLWQPRSQS